MDLGFKCLDGCGATHQREQEQKSCEQYGKRRSDLERGASSEYSDSTHLFILNIELRNPSSTKATPKIHHRKSSKDEAVTMADINLS